MALHSPTRQTSTRSGSEQCEQHVDLGDDYQVRSLGIDAETTTQILEYIKTRDKVATFSLPWVIEANGFPHPEARHPHCAVRLRRSNRI